MTDAASLEMNTKRIKRIRRCNSYLPFRPLPLKLFLLSLFLLKMSNLKQYVYASTISPCVYSAAFHSKEYIELYTSIYSQLHRPFSIIGYLENNKLK